MKMKKIIILLAAAVLFASCDKFLTREPLDFMSPETSYETESALDKALAGVYDMLGHRNLYGGYFLYNCGFDADDGHFARNSPSTGPAVYNFSSTDVTVYYVWESLYKGVSRANMLLANVDNNPEIPIEYRDRVRGEALALRAYYYFLLVSLWGDVPLLTEPVTDPENIFIARSPAKDVYERIMKDLTDAEDLVQDITEIGHGGRISKSAVRGIAARVCLHWAGEPVKDESKYEEARKWALKVIEDDIAGHKLNPDYSSVFINYAKDEYDIGESIWEVEFYGTDSEVYEELTMAGRYTGPTSNAASIGKCLGMVYATGTLWDKYPDDDAEDTRKFWNIAAFSYNLDGTKKFSNSTTYPSLFYRFMGKTRREYWPHPESENTSINVPLLRYSDVLLMYAEAENAVNGPTQSAINAVNEVRRRALSTGIRSVTVTNPGSGYTSAPSIVFKGDGIVQPVAEVRIAGGGVQSVTFERDAVYGLSNGRGFTSAPVIEFTGGGGSGAEAVCELYDPSLADVPTEYTTSSEQFLKFIQDERSRELCFECLRRSDLIRWGIFYESMNEVYNLVLQEAPDYYYLKTFGNVTEGKHELWPIPAQEISQNPYLTQNPNW